MEMIMMMDPAVKCLCLLAVVAILFVTEKLPLAVTSVFAAIFCWLLGLVPIEQVFLGLADSTVVLFGGMFIVGAAMFYTGLAQDIGGQIVKLFGTGEIKLMVGIMVIAAVMSAFLSNTGTTACLIPVVIGICKEAHIPVSREMMPLAFAAGLGGTCTLIGTPPNIIATRTSPSVSVRSRPGSHERAMTPVMSSVPLSSNIINFSLIFRCYLCPGALRNGPVPEGRSSPAARHSKSRAATRPRSKHIWVQPERHGHPRRHSRRIEPPPTPHIPKSARSGKAWDKNGG